MSSTGSRASLQQGISKTRYLMVIIALGLILFSTAAYLNSANTSASSLIEADFSEFSAAQITRGEYLAIAGNCASCHTAEGGDFMAGGLRFETPFGGIYSTNITPDPETGIGAWSGMQFLASMRRGLRPNGEHLYPVFPYTAFTKMTDDDIVALFAYLNSIPPIRQAATENEIAFPFNQRSLMAVWKALYFAEGAYEVNESRSTEWNRGAYLVEALTHCSACHSPRNFLGAEKTDLAMAGGEYTDKVPGGALVAWSAPNLTSAGNGLGMWPLEEVIAYLKTGINNYVETFGPMNEVIINSTRHLDENDVRAMAVYLKSLPAIPDEQGKPAERSVLGMGKTVYNLNCGTCHLPTGLGDEESAPRLAAGSLVVRAGNPASLINAILYSPELPDPPLPSKRRKPMEEFQYLLTDDEIAAVASYIRATWGNMAGEVTAEQVARQR